MHMELINNTFIPEKEIPRSRRAAGRKAFLQTFRNLFTSRNHFRRFMDTYRFNTIRWSASNLHEPSWENGSDYSFVPKIQSLSSGMITGAIAVIC